MKSLMASGVVSTLLHAGVAAAFAALAAFGLMQPRPVNMGIQVVLEAGDWEIRVEKPVPEVEFEKAEAPRKLEHPMSAEEAVERPAPLPMEIEEGRLVPRPAPPPPVLDRPVRPTALKMAPSAAAVTETAPAEILNPPPDYPVLARRRGYEGSVVLAFEILPDGTCDGVRVAEPSGYEVLDQAAVRAVQGWRFKPALRNGEPIAVTQRIRFTFRLQG